MKLIDLTCSNCGAQLRVNSELTKCICNFCGKEMLIDNGIIRHKVEISNGVNFGYQQGIGLGISKAEQKAYELKSLIEFYNSFCKYADKPLYDLEIMQNWLNTTKYGKVALALSILLWVLMVHFYLIICGIIGSKSAVSLGIGLLAIVLIIQSIIILINDKEKKQYLKTRSEYTQKCENIVVYLDEMYNKSNKIVSKAYATSNIVSTLISYLQNGRADSIKEAINLYEQERMQMAQMRQLNQINANAVAVRRAADAANMSAGVASILMMKNKH